MTDKLSIESSLAPGCRCPPQPMAMPRFRQGVPRALLRARCTPGSVLDVEAYTRGHGCSSSACATPSLP